MNTIKSEKIRESKIVVGGLKWENDVRVPKITYLPSGANFSDSFITIKITNSDQMMGENEIGEEEILPDVIYIEMNKRIARDFMNKLKFALDNFR